jgi:hypothetical protein
MVPRRLAALVAEEWLTFDADDSTSTLTLWALVIGGAALVAIPLRRTLAALDEPTRSGAGAMLLGSQLALVPVLAVDASPRLLSVALLGLAPVLALVIERAWFPAEPPPRKGAAGLTELVALGIAFFQLVHGPATAFIIGQHFRRTSAAFASGIADLHRRVPDPAHTEILILRGGPSSFFMPFALAGYGQLPARWRVLSMTGHVLGIRRSPRTLDLVAGKGWSMLSWFSWDLFRDTSRNMEPGQVFGEPGLLATVVDVGSAGPRRVTFELEQTLESPRYVWVTESARETFPSVTLPAQGFGQPYDP